jgi:hypothetical protein
MSMTTQLRDRSVHMSRINVVDSNSASAELGKASRVEIDFPKVDLKLAS